MDSFQENVQKNLIWTEIHCYELVLGVARKNGIPENHPFMDAMKRIMEATGKDLIEATNG